MARAFLQLFLVVLVIGSSAGASETNKEEVEIIAKLTYFAENAVWFDYVDGAESFHISVFVAISPEEYCGKEIQVRYSHLPDGLEAAQTVGESYRLRIYSEQAEMLIEGQPKDTHTEFFYNTVNAIRVEGDEAPIEGKCPKKPN